MILAGLLTPPGLRAAPLAYEGFDYPAGSTLSGRSGGSGWNGVWQTANNGSADILDAGLAAGGNAPPDYDLLSAGNSAHLPNARRVGRKLDTSAAGPFGSRGYINGSGLIGENGKTLYVSFMQQADGTLLYYEFEFHRGSLGDPGRIAGIGNDQGGDNVHLRAPNGTHTLIGPGNTAVNFYVVRIDFKEGNDDIYVYRNPTSATEPAVPTLTRLSAADMSFDGISFGAFANGRTVTHDEVRLGETWEDVTIPPVAAPAITRQPKASTTGFVGGTVVLSAEAGGRPLPTYQWFKGVEPLDGETSATLTLSNLQSTDAGDYRLTATNPQGSVTTHDAHVEVVEAAPGLLAYEGFDYGEGQGVLAGKAGGIGWGATWANVNGGGGSVISGSLAAGNNAPNGHDGESLGNSSHIPNAQRDGRLLDTSPGGRFGAAGYIDANGNIGADGKTLYISFLQQPDGTTKFYEFEFHRGDLGDPGRIGGVGNDTNNPTVSLRTAGVQTLIGPGSTGVNFYVVRIDFKTGNDDVRVYQNPVSATEPAMATLSVADASDMSFNGISIAAFDNGRTVRHDEIRLGQSWSDVVFGVSRRDLVWVGDGVSNEWNFLANNWSDGAGATAFVDGDPVTFDDSGSGAPAVNVTADVSTASITLDNSVNDYTLGGTGTITSSGGLHKLGGGAFTLTAPAAFGGSIVADGGDFALNGTSTTSGNLSLNAGIGDVTLGGSNTFAGSLLDAGAGARALSGTNTFTGLVSTNADFTLTGDTHLVGGGSVVWIGNLSGAYSTLTIEAGAALNITGAYNDALVVGRDGGSGAVIQNGGTVTYNPSNRDSAFIGASGSAPGTTASYEMNGGTLDMSNMRLGIALGGIDAGVTATLNQTGGDILVRQLELGSVLPGGEGAYNLEGGSITIGAGGITTVSGLYSIQLGGGTVAAAADWQSSMAMTLSGTGTIFDTAGHTVRLSGFIDGFGGLVKNGSGTLILDNFNSFAGPALVNAGTLGGSGSSDNSVLTVSSGATLAPGYNITAAFYCASADLDSGSTFHVKIDNSFTDADRLQAFETVDISGANVTFSEIGVGFIPAGTELVIVEAPGGLTGTFAGHPEGTEISTGTNTFTIHYTSTQVKLASTTVASPYLVWASINGLDGSPGKDPAFEADPEGDGIANGLEWILGGNPLAPDAASLLDASGDGTAGLILTFDREESSIGTAGLIVQWSTGLDGNWTDVPVEASGGSYASGVTVIVDEGATPDRVTVTIPASNAPDGKLFARLKAVAP